jgi:hypothetical protein
MGFPNRFMGDVMVTNETLIQVLSEIVVEWDVQHEHETHQTGYTPDTGGIAWAREILQIVKG